MSTSPYHEAGRIVTEVVTKRRGLKSVAFAEDALSRDSRKGKRKQCTKATYAQACQTLQRKTLLDALLARNGGKLRRAIKFDDARQTGLVYVLLHELLFGRYGSIRGGGKLKRNIVAHERELKEARDAVVRERGGDGGGGSTSTGANNGGGTTAVLFPRYVRVNTLKTTPVEAVKSLRRDLRKGGDDTEEDVIPIYADAHVPDLLVLPPTIAKRLHDRDAVTSGKVVLQDKSSCFPALALVHGFGGCSKDGSFHEEAAEEMGDYIDACAAPGNKTSHLAALVAGRLKVLDEQRRMRAAAAGGADEDGAGLPSESSGGDGKNKKKRKKKKRKNNDSPPGQKSTIFAFDRSSARIKILRDRLSALVPEEDGVDPASSTGVRVEAVHGDFLRIDPSDPRYANVKSILLDPSCSGSGIVTSPDRAAAMSMGSEEEQGDGDGGTRPDGDASTRRRIESLANFQLLMLKHALSFPRVSRVVYSTCSVHDAENEGVVGRALSEVNGDAVDEDTEGREGWEIISPWCLSGWRRRGRPEACLKAGEGLMHDDASKMIRCDGLGGDGTNGFFVCCLERRQEDKSDKGTNMMRIRRKAAESELIHPPDGVVVYDGEFDVPHAAKRDGYPGGCSTDVNASGGEVRTRPVEDDGASLDLTSSPLVSEKKRGGQLGSGEGTGKSVAGNKSAKKREKKLAWKRRQMERKLERLKKQQQKKSLSS